jgi:hypothetical protein
MIFFLYGFIWPLAVVFGVLLYPFKKTRFLSSYCFLVPTAAIIASSSFRFNGKLCRGCVIADERG